VDGKIVADEQTPVPDDPVEAMTRPGEVRAAVPLAPGQQAEIGVAFRPAPAGAGPVSVRLGVAAEPDDEAMLASAVRAAAAAEAAVVVVGSAELTESEGFDRSTLALPGRQDELVRRVAEVNDRTAVVVNAGMPVLMPWTEQVAAVLYAWLPGQAMGDALADVLLGRVEPGGRLPVTLPRTEADCPVLYARPRDGRLDYDEGLLIGYRGYDRRETEPLFPFGHGHGYTSWAYESIRAAPGDLDPGAEAEVTVVVRNTGSRPGREVVQAYLSAPDGQQASADDARRPLRTLAAFGAARAAPGQTAEVTLRIPARAFARYESGGWSWPGGRFTVQAGRSSRDLRLSLPLVMRAPG
jgi:beta-glucosidase